MICSDNKLSKLQFYGLSDEEITKTDTVLQMQPNEPQFHNLPELVLAIFQIRNVFGQTCVIMVKTL